MSEFDDLMKKTMFAVEANSFEEHCLWDKYNSKLKWGEFTSGTMKTFYSESGRPICVSLCWAYINDFLVLFYFPTSELVDWVIINEWLESLNFKYKTDAQKFHNIVIEINDLRKNEIGCVLDCYIERGQDQEFVNLFNTDGKFPVLMNKWYHGFTDKEIFDSVDHDNAMLVKKWLDSKC
ncbi:MAG: hypothetical protein WC679_02475 [Bacteroidales bacterium]|jgi:hypothetical protein